jgi:hypothetical protein
VLGFTDEEIHSLTALLSPLLPPMRDDFLQAVADPLAVYPGQLRGPGLVHRTTVAINHDLLKNGPVAADPGGKYSRAGQPKRQRRRR